jgi:hypothetical protein
VISINALFFLTGVLQGLIVSVLLFFRSRLNKLSKWLLIGFILVNVAQVLFKVISKDWIGTYFSPFGILAYQIVFLFGPLAYLFIKYAVNQRLVFALKDLLHLFPFLFFWILLILFQHGGETFNPLQYYFPNNWSRGVIYLSLQLFSITYYALKSIQQCRDAEQLRHINIQTRRKRI